MGIFKAISNDLRNFNLTWNDTSVGVLKYPKWYSFKASIFLPNKSEYRLEPKGFWNSKIELIKNNEVLLDFKMSWKGISITSNIGNTKNKYLLKPADILSGNYVLIDESTNESLMNVKSSFQWNIMRSEYTIVTSEEIDDSDYKELLMLTILHCINYQMMLVVTSIK